MYAGSLHAEDFKMARKAIEITESKRPVLAYTLLATGIVLILVGIIRGLNASHQLENADEDDYGDGFMGFIRRLFKRHPKKSVLTDTERTQIMMHESLKYNAEYFKTLTGSGTMLGNAKALLKEMASQDITSPYAQAGLLAVVSKESNFVYKRENLNYDAAGLMKVFKLPADIANKVAHKPEAIANIVYMPPHNTQLGNHLPGDGWAFRGGGPNQITGRAAFEKYGKEIGVDLVSNPDRIDEPEIAAKACVDFFKDGFAALMKSSITLKDGTKETHAKFYNNPTGDINKFSNELDAAAAFYNINAGVGQTESFLLADVTGGRALCMARATGFLDFIKQQAQAA